MNNTIKMNSIWNKNNMNLDDSRNRRNTFWNNVPNYKNMEDTNQQKPKSQTYFSSSTYVNNGGTIYTNSRDGYRNDLGVQYTRRENTQNNEFVEDINNNGSYISNTNITNPDNIQQLRDMSYRNLSNNYLTRPYSVAAINDLKPIINHNSSYDRLIEDLMYFGFSREKVIESLEQNRYNYRKSLKYLIDTR